jgi:D-alanyl-D-alanine carboxypeptidase
MRLHALAAVATVFLATLAATAAPAQATPYVVIEADTGRVVSEQEATSRWYPASLTKLVTLYVALQAVRDGRVTLQTPLVVSLRANKAAPSKMGFKPGTEVTLGNALKMLMVKSANDIAITIAEGLGGSVEDFATMMNATAVRLGMRESHFVNPNGLHSDEHFSSARDMALIGYALFRDFDQYSGFFGIGALRLEDQIIPTHNGLLGRYPGADGMKTGFTCPAGFNVVASAARGNRRLIAVVLGYPNAKARSLKAASLLDTGFASNARRTTIDALPSVAGAPPNMRSRVCGPNRERVAEDEFATVAGQTQDNERPAFFSSQGSGPSSGVAVLQAQMGTRPAFEPEEVYIGRAPGYMGPSLSARSTYVAAAVGAAATAAMVSKHKAVPAKATKGKLAKPKGKPKKPAR